MRSRWLGGLVMAAVSTLALPAPALAAPGGHHHGRRSAVAPVVSVRYYFNGGDAFADSSGFGHDLALASAHGGAVHTVSHDGRGTAAVFPAKCTARVCPHAALQAPSSQDLNPGKHDFAYGATVLLAPGQTSDGENVVQKGYSITSSQWKLQVDGVAGLPSCVLVGTRDSAIHIVHSAVSVADGAWHAIECRRAGTTLEVLVDHVVRGEAKVPADLAVSNSRPLSIGGKGAFANNDQFNGAVDDVWIGIS